MSAKTGCAEVQVAQHVRVGFDFRHEDRYRVACFEHKWRGTDTTDRRLAKREAAAHNTEHLLAPPEGEHA